LKFVFFYLKKKLNHTIHYQSEAKEMYFIVNINGHRMYLFFVSIWESYRSDSKKCNDQFSDEWRVTILWNISRKNS